MLQMPPIRSAIVPVAETAFDGHATRSTPRRRESGRDEGVLLSAFPVPQRHKYLANAIMQLVGAATSCEVPNGCTPAVAAQLEFRISNSPGR